MRQIKKFGDPNGIVQFSELDFIERIYNEPTNDEGPLNISFTIIRREGVMGDVTVNTQDMHDFSLPGRFSLSLCLLFWKHFQARL